LGGGDIKEIGMRLRKYRQKNHLTQSELAKLTNYSPSYIGDIETSRTTPSVKTLEILSEALNIHITMFFKDECCRQRLKNGCEPVHGINAEICLTCPLFIERQTNLITDEIKIET
jgi:transcriptional regulator with XRE-family HTH domain